jgi:hypothetical protein
MIQGKLQTLIRRVLKEEIEKREAEERVPCPKDNEVTPHRQEKKTKIELVDEIRKMVEGIDKSYVVGWDDHDDISIKAGDLFKVRIIPRWEANYDIESYVRNEDRFYYVNRSWDQVKEFVKKNFSKLKDSYLNQAAEKGKTPKDATPAAEKGMKGGEKVKEKKVGDSKNKDMDFNQKEVSKKDEQPDQPMKEVGEFRRQSEFKTKDPVKLRKKHDNDKHVVKI